MRGVMQGDFTHRSWCDVLLFPPDARERWKIGFTPPHLEVPVMQRAPFGDSIAALTSL